MAGFKEYTMMFQLSAATSAQFTSAFGGAQNQIAQLQSKIDALNKQQGNITAYTRQQQAVEKTKSKLETLKQQYENLQKAQAKAGGEDVNLQNKMLDKQRQIEKTSDSLNQQTQKLDAMGNALHEAGVDTGNLAAESQRLEAELSGLRGEQEAVADAAQESSEGFAQAAEAMESMLVASGVVDLMQNIGGAMKECADASIQYETAMAGVMRTVGGGDSFIADLGDSFKELSTQIPITAEELAGIATTAGQLGIAQADVEEFTTVMAQLATTTDLTADDAATMLAQFANITGTTQYDRLGSTIAELGDATATTASKVVEMSQGMAAAASQAGFSETDILAVSAAVGSLGIEAQAGSTAMSTLISTLYKAVETGDGLEDFAAIAGMTADQFKTAWAEDAAGAMDTFIQGLNDVERNGKSAVVILDELGINNVRQTKAILGLASAGDLLSSTIDQANAAWDSNTALAEKAGIMYDTTEAKLTMMQNAANNVKIAVGDALTPAIGDLAAAATDVLQPVSTFLADNPALVKALAAGVGVLGGATAGVVGLSAAMKAATVVSGMFSASLGPVFAVAAGVAGLTALAVGLSSALGDTRESFEDLDMQFDDTIRQIDEQQQIIDLCDQYRQLQTELGYTSDDLASLGDEDVGITFTASIVKEGFDGESDIAMIKELADSITDDEGELRQLLEINGAEAVTDEALDKIVDLAADITTDDGTLRQELSVIGVDNVSDEDLQTIRALAAEITEKHGELSQAAQLIGLDNVTEDDIQLIADLSAAITSNSGELTQLLKVNGADEVTDDDIARIVNFAAVIGSDDGELRQTLAAVGVDDVTDADIARIRELAQNIQTDNGTLTETLSLMGFENYDDIVAACGLADDVAASNVSSTISITLDNVDETVAHLNEMAAELTTAKNDLSTAQAELAALEEQYTKTNNKSLATNEKAEKSAYAVQLEELSEAITTQKTKVGDLQSEYDALNAEYEAGSAAVQEFYDKQAQAAAIAEQLGLSASAASGGIAEETAAMNAQLDTVEALAKARQAELRAQLYDNATAQAKKYAQAVAENNDLLAELAPWEKQVADTEKYLKMNAEDVNTAFKESLKAYDALAASETFDPASKEARDLMGEINALNVVMGNYFGDLSQYADGTVSLFDSFGYYETTDAMMQDSIAHMNEMVAQYGDQIKGNQALIDEFIENITNGVENGAITIEEAEGLLSRTFSSIEGGGELAGEIMAGVASAMTKSANSADDMAEGLDDATASALDMQNAISPIIAQMDELSKAYADAYESAKSSLDGQFELFELAGDLASIDMTSQWVNASEKNPESDKSNQSMREALDSQAKWFEDYNALLQQAQERGVNTDLLATIADGTAESVETLKRLTADSTTDADIAALNAAYATVGDAKAELAGTMADIETDYTSTMANLQAQMESTVGEMDMSAEAAAAAESTFQAMITKANAMLPLVSAAYKAVADAAAANLNVNSGGTGVGHAATGTDSAETGFYMVGEHGPELVFMHGGEQVFTASQTAAMMQSMAEPAAMSALPAEALPYSGTTGADQPIQLEYTANYTITGSTNADELRAILEEHDAAFRDQLEGMMADVEADRARRSLV